MISGRYGCCPWAERGDTFFRTLRLRGGAFGIGVRPRETWVRLLWPTRFRDRLAHERLTPADSRSIHVTTLSGGDTLSLAPIPALIEKPRACAPRPMHLARMERRHLQCRIHQFVGRRDALETGNRNGGVCVAGHLALPDGRPLRQGLHENALVGAVLHDERSATVRDAVPCRFTFRRVSLMLSSIACPVGLVALRTGKHSGGRDWGDVKTVRQPASERKWSRCGSAMGALSRTRASLCCATTS